MSRPNRRRAATPPLLLALTLACAAALGLVLYAASTSLPFLMLSPASDPHFGPANQCLASAFPEPRVGFAVGWDGGAVASYGGSHLARCAAPEWRVRTDPMRGIQCGAYDSEGTLWLGARPGPDAGEQLWRLSPDGGAAVVGDVAAVALAGTTRGVVSLDENGRLVSLAREGDVLASQSVPPASARAVQLSSNAEGTLVAIVEGGGLWVFRAGSLERIRAEAPCDVEFLWWTVRPDEALLSCGPDGSFALRLEVTTGGSEAAPRQERTRSTLVPGMQEYVQPCEVLPCTAPSP